jgi:NADH:ubiquinone oxidoreductase subunit 6 (subunit J)
MKNKTTFLFPLATAVITLALLFVAIVNGWFGEPTGVGSVFCEADRPGLIKQPVNTWSNLGFIFTGLYIGWLLAQGKYNHNKNSLTQKTFYAAFFSSLVVYLGPGSMAMHATTTAIGGFLDMLSMYLIAAFLVSYAAERFFKLSALYFSLIFVSVLSFCVWANFQDVHFIFDFFGNTVFAFFVSTAIFFEALNIYVRKMQHESKWAFLSFGALLLALLIWNLWQNETTLCNPYSLIQGHGIWHVLNAVSLYFLFRYYVSEHAG